MRLKLARRASRDLEAIHLRGCEQFGLEAAERYLDGVWETLAFLLETPRAARERRELGASVRAYPYGTHLIVYEIDGDVLNVIRIPHGREDWQSGL